MTVQCLHRLEVRTSPFHGENRSSILLGDAIDRYFPKDNVFRIFLPGIKRFFTYIV